MFTIIHLKIPSVRTLTLLKPHILAFTTLLQTSWESDCAFNLWNNRKIYSNNFNFKHCRCIATKQISSNSKELSTYIFDFKCTQTVLLHRRCYTMISLRCSGAQEGEHILRGAGATLWPRLRHAPALRTTEELIYNYYRRFECSLMLQKENWCIESQGCKLLNRMKNRKCFLILLLLFFHLVLPFRSYRRYLHVSQKTK